MGLKQVSILLLFIKYRVISISSSPSSSLSTVLRTTRIVVFRPYIFIPASQDYLQSRVHRFIHCTINPSPVTGLSRATLYSPPRDYAESQYRRASALSRFHFVESGYYRRVEQMLFKWKNKINRNRENLLGRVVCLRVSHVSRARTHTHTQYSRITQT